MKAHLAKLSLALLSAVFLLGCQDLGSEPVGPEGLGIQLARKKPPKDGGGGGTVPADITVTGGLVTQDLTDGTPNTQVVGFKDSGTEIELSATDPKSVRINLAFNMINTLAATRLVCVQSGRGSPDDEQLNTLFNLLQHDVRTINFFFVGIDKTVLVEDTDNPGVFVGASEDHRIAANGHVDGTTRLFKVATFGNLPDVPEITVSKSGNITSGLTFVFTGGSIRLGNLGGTRTAQDNFYLTCPNLDTITMVLTSQ